MTQHEPELQLPGHALPPVPGAARPAGAGYVQVPIALLRAYAHDPLALGCYLAVARCALAARGAVPLSAADLVRWSGGAGAAAVSQVRRRLAQLVRAGWLTQHGGGGRKARLLPTWGQGRDGQPHPWCWEVPRLGRPARCAVVCVATALLDNGLGRLDPMQGHRPAVRSALPPGPVLSLPALGRAALRQAGIAQRESQSESQSESGGSGGIPRPGAELPPPPDPMNRWRINQSPLPPTYTADTRTSTNPAAAQAEDSSGMHQVPPLHPEVRANHTVLNACRAIHSAEWAELCLLQQQHGAVRLLAWQARALRVGHGRQRPQGVTPAYYTACADQEARSPAPSSARTCAPGRRQPRPSIASAPLSAPPVPTSPALPADGASVARATALPPVAPAAAAAAPTAPGAVPRDAAPAITARLQQLGVRHPGALRRLATVDPDLLTRWEQACAHPGMDHLARDVGALVASCLQQGSEPPPRPRLDAACPARPQGSGFDLAAFLATPAPAPAAPTYTAADLAAAVAASSFRPRRFTGWNAPAADPVSSPCLPERNAP